jgi:hypothetical protein
MAGNPPISGNMQPLVGIVQNPAITTINDGNQALVGVGRNGGLLTTPVRGSFGEMTHRKATFWIYATSAGIAVPINTTTSGSTFGLYNPPGSGVYAEIIDLEWTQLAAGPATINQVGFSVVNTVTNAISAITSCPGPIRAGGNPGNFSGGASACTGFSAATFASALTVAANWGIPGFSFALSYQPTATYNTGPFHKLFHGKFVVPPGWAITLTASTAWAANTAVPGMSWAEYPI